MSYEWWILIIGSLVEITCGITGCFLILRKLAMLADAISHTVLLGIILTFMISQSMNGFYMLIGATFVGLLTAFFVQLFHSSGIQEDASIRVVFTFLFAVGVILITMFADNVHLDVDNALMGEITFIPWDTVKIGFIPAIPKAFIMLSIVLIIDLIIIFIFYKEFKLTSYDPQMATAIGIPVLLIYYLLDWNGFCNN